jgi:hypothetical protein
VRKLLVASCLVVLGGTSFVAIETLRANADAASPRATAHAADATRVEHAASREAPHPTSAPPAPSVPDVLPHMPAPGEPPPTPAMQRRDLVERLTATGATTAAWTRDAATLIDRWREAAPTDAAGVTFTLAQCFAGGCLVTASYPDMQHFDAVNRTFPDSEAFRGWNGGKYRTPPEQRPDGRWEADWLFLPPDDPIHEPLDHRSQGESK